MKERVHFSFATHWISNLLDTTNKNHILFNSITFLYGIFNTFFSWKVQSLLPSNTLTTITTFLLSIYSFLVILIIFFPLSKNFKVHCILAKSVFLSILIALVLLYLQIITSPALRFLLLATIITGVLLISSVTKIQHKYKKLPKTLVNIRNKEKSPLIKSASILEWLFVFLIVSFQITTLLC